MNIYFNSQNENYKSPFGSVCVGEYVTFSIELDNLAEIKSCSLIISNEEGMFKKSEMTLKKEREGRPKFTVSVKFDKTDLYFYRFELVTEKTIYYYGDNEKMLGGEGKVYKGSPKDYQIIVHLNEKVADWFKEGIIYQIFPDRFRRGENWWKCQNNAKLKEDFIGARRIIMHSWNDKPFYPKDQNGAVTRWPFFGGNLNGITDKLFYLKSLGVTVIYLNPIFSALSNHKYDTWDYLKIDESFGTEYDFKKLCNEAERMGIRIILDGVFNHVGAESPYFDRNNNFNTLGACRGIKSPYYNWFTFIEFPKKYKAWWGMGDLPEVNEVPEFMNFIYDVIRYWLKMGAGGFRLDVADELSDAFIEEIRKAAKSVKKDAVIIGEVWEDASNKVSYGRSRKYFLGKELDSTMNYVFRDEAISYVMGDRSSADFCQKIFDLYEEYPKENFYSEMNLLGSHDKMRILTLLGEAPSNLSEKEKENYKLPKNKLELSKKRLKILAALQFAMPGVPSIYYGDEVGAEGYEDPFNRGPYPWGSEDKELLNHYKALSEIRRNYEVMRSGLFVSESLDGNLLCIRRFDNRKALTVITVINNSKTMTKVARIHVGDDKILAIKLLDSEDVVIKDEYIKLSLSPMSFEIIYLSSYTLTEYKRIKLNKYNKLKDVFNYLAQKNGTKEWQVWPEEERDIEIAETLDVKHEEYEVFDTLDFFISYNSFETWAYKEAFILDDLGYPINKEKYPAYNQEKCYDLFIDRFASVINSKGYVILNDINKYISYEVTAPNGEVYEIPGPGRRLFEKTKDFPVYVKNPDLTIANISNLIKTTSLKVLED